MALRTDEESFAAAAVPIPDNNHQLYVVFLPRPIATCTRGEYPIDLHQGVAAAAAESRHQDLRQFVAAARP
jgi:hypothetical protein